MFCNDNAYDTFFLLLCRGVSGVISVTALELSARKVYQCCESSVREIHGVSGIESRGIHGVSRIESREIHGVPEFNRSGSSRIERIERSASTFSEKPYDAQMKDTPASMEALLSPSVSPT